MRTLISEIGPKNIAKFESQSLENNAKFVNWPRERIAKFVSRPYEKNCYIRQLVAEKIATFLSVAEKNVKFIHRFHEKQSRNLSVLFEEKNYEILQSIAIRKKIAKFVYRLHEKKFQYNYK